MARVPDGLRALCTATRGQEYKWLHFPSLRPPILSVSDIGSVHRLPATQRIEGCNLSRERVHFVKKILQQTMTIRAENRDDRMRRGVQSSSAFRHCHEQVLTEQQRRRMLPPPSLALSLSLSSPFMDIRTWGAACA